MRPGVKAGAGIQRLAFHKGGSHRIKNGLLLLMPRVVEVVDNRTIQSPDYAVRFSTCVGWHRRIQRSQEALQFIVRLLHQANGFRLQQIQAIP